jgi:hypothetical protein
LRAGRSATSQEKFRALLEELNGQATPTAGYLAIFEVCGFNDWLLQHGRAWLLAAAGEPEIRNQDSGHFALTPALSRGQAGSVCCKSSRGRGGTRGFCRWAVIGNEAWHGRALAWIVSLAPVGERVADRPGEGATHSPRASRVT